MTREGRLFQQCQIVSLKKKKEFLLKGNKQTTKKAPNCWFTGDYLVHVLAIIVKTNWLVRGRFRKLPPVKQIL